MKAALALAFGLLLLVSAQALCSTVSKEVRVSCHLQRNGGGNPSDRFEMAFKIDLASKLVAGMYKATITEDEIKWRGSDYRYALDRYSGTIIAGDGVEIQKYIGTCRVMGKLL